MKTKRIVIGFCGAALIAAAGVGIRGWRAKPASAAVDPSMATVQRGSVRASIDAIGSIEPLRKIDIKAKVSGQVLDVLVDVGSRVRAGDVLARLDPRDAQRDLALARAQEEVTQAALAHALQVHDIQKRAQLQGGASTLELIRADADAQRLRAELSVKRAEQAKLQAFVSYTDLRTPIDGVVLARNTNPGEMVTAGVQSTVDGKPLLVVAFVDKLLVRTELHQLDVVRLHVGDQVSIRVDALPDRAFKGTIHRSAAMAQRSERRKDSDLMVFPVDVIVDTAQPGADQLRPGMTGELNIDLAEHHNTLFVPLVALVREGASTRLRKLDANNTESLVDVVIGLQNERQVEIISGIEEGARIRVQPASKTE